MREQVRRPRRVVLLPEIAADDDQSVGVADVEQRAGAALLYVRDADRLVVVGSNFGQQHHPAWTSNLLAQPEASVTMAGRDIPVLATPVTGAEKDRLYRRFVELAGAYAVYRGRTDRDLGCSYSRAAEQRRCVAV
ncbi:nitroreductase family deazaflavin-dependent oxidoreductase [Rhodococcus hoagii]|nr:nitroreductase family deazaflavin-dependent oxidoreductase [Prescottella equi]